MDNQNKILTRVQLVNWHFFEDERMSIHGSTLISGENTAGKSTILDAIQLVLTTNTRRFNMAANDKGKRNLKGYVRCKIGNVGETYLRKNTVPANVALEFYEEKGDRYFVIGVHMTSPDEESAVKTKWYVEECRLEDMSFIVNNRAALDSEFRVKGKRIHYIEQKNVARDRFKRRLGNLDDKFFDIIPKSLAFKPMDNVKDFINKFVLSENKIDVDLLRENIETLKELEDLLERSNKQYIALNKILDVYNNIEKNDYDILINDMLISIADKEALIYEIEECEKEIRQKLQYAETTKDNIHNLNKSIKVVDDQIIDINVAIQSNSCHERKKNIQDRIEKLEEQKSVETHNISKLKEQVRALKLYIRELQKIDYTLLINKDIDVIENKCDISEKNEVLEKLVNFKEKEYVEIRRKEARLDNELDELTEAIKENQMLLRQLEKNKLEYPSSTVALKKAIEDEFEKRGIKSKAYILAQLLEITDKRWTNAVEGYLNTQKFNIIVEPQYYDIALEVYHRKIKEIHSAGLINTKKLVLDIDINNKTLAYVVKSENRYAKAYANYILGRVYRCDTVQELENYDIAITDDCMLYQGYVVKHLNPKVYKNPYIGQEAYRTQIINTRKELENLSQKRSQLRGIRKIYSDISESERKVNIGLIEIYIKSPNKLEDIQQEIAKEKTELAQIQEDPNFIQLQIELEEKKTQKVELEKEKEVQIKEEARLNNQLEVIKVTAKEKEEQLGIRTSTLDEKMDNNVEAYEEALNKYNNNRKTKSARKIVENYKPQRVHFENIKADSIANLKILQGDYNRDFTEDFTIGVAAISEYREAAFRLHSVDIIKYDEKLRQAKDDCEQIFKSDFLSKMKELIESAKNEFRNLNKALNNIYYGEDSYHFTISFDKKKEGLYRMITSENNQEGFNLWTEQFENEYKEEMEELFDKLMTKDDNGEKIVEEYTDYRSYLDYDIEIRKRNGSVQKFSNIYGEKSGSETQVPYYVAIAASFYQLYRFGNSIKIMLLDEAFDKMDDERIASMLEFYRSLGLQVIMATPPAKIETIGENVDTILTAIRVGQASIVEEYNF